MANNQKLSLVLPLSDTSASLERAGGKGASLARLAAAGLPVPPGFHVTTAAYKLFVKENKLQEQILATVAEVDVERPNLLNEVSQRIAELFASGTMPEVIRREIRRAYSEFGGGKKPVAVRSSATAEDLPGMSFAGQQESYLNVCGEDSVLSAVQRCWASLWTARAIEYRSRYNISPEEVSLAVVVQEMVTADAAGVLFTANPMNGVRSQVVINAAWGLGEAIVSGKVNPDTFVVDSVIGKVIEQQINKKEVMTVRTAEGTHEEAVPEEKRTQAVLNTSQIDELVSLGVKIEELYEWPMDIEWTIDSGRISIVQARPITVLPGHNPQKGEFNDSLTGYYLWANSNVGEAFSDVMTPCTWSLAQILFIDEQTMAACAVPFVGNIGGRFYLNQSVAMSLMAALGIDQKKYYEMTEEVVGRVPEGLEIPVIPLSREHVLSSMGPITQRLAQRRSEKIKKLDDFLAATPERCEKMENTIAAISNGQGLIDMWQNEVLPFALECYEMLDAATKQQGEDLSGGWTDIRGKLQKMVGEKETNALLTGLVDGENQLASLGPVVGLNQLARGEIDRVTFIRKYGHRSPHELEVSIPRPAEDPEWIDKQLDGLREAKVDAGALLQRQKEARDTAWERLRARDPHQEKPVRKLVDQWAKIARDREAVRSEFVRAFWVIRDFMLRAGKISGIGEDIFFLSVDETLALLSGDNTSVAYIPERRANYNNYCALPPYPALILGYFDPFKWAADPERRSDLFDSRGNGVTKSQGITGFAGAAGIVEGKARVILTVEEGEQLKPGEILVTASTNIGWTPLFPRAAAVVTDVGAPLSHAAIVARELGIPAVVGCGNATMSLQTGDLVRVNGEEGTVEILQEVSR